MIYQQAQAQHAAQQQQRLAQQQQQAAAAGSPANQPRSPMPNPQVQAAAALAAAQRNSPMVAAAQLGTRSPMPAAAQQAAQAQQQQPQGPVQQAPPQHPQHAAAGQHHPQQTQAQAQAQAQAQMYAQYAMLRQMQNPQMQQVWEDDQMMQQAGPSGYNGGENTVEYSYLDHASPAEQHQQAMRQRGGAPAISAPIMQQSTMNW